MKRILFTYVLLCLAGVFGVVMGQAPIPVITSNPSNACAGGDVQFTIAASNNPTQYRWQSVYNNTWTDIFDNSVYSGTGTATLTVHTENGGTNQIYHCYAINASGYSEPSFYGYLNSVAPDQPDPITGPSQLCQGASGDYHVRWPDEAELSKYPVSYNWTYSGTGVSNQVLNTPQDTLIWVQFSTTASSGTLSVTASNGCGVSIARTVDIAINPLQPTLPSSPSATCIQTYVPRSGTTFSDGVCNTIASILPTSGYALDYITQTCVTVDAAVQTFNGIPYVPRHYNISPQYPSYPATATVTLYFTQGDFDVYNLAKGSNPALPTGSADATGISNLRITQFHGTGTDPGTYVGGSGEIDPDDNNIVWNASANRWEVTFDITGFSGFFISTGSLTPLPLTLISFNGQSITGGNLLEWITSSEQNTRSFEIQRNEGNGFQPLATVPAAGNSHQNLSYSYTDPLDGSASYSYRLKMIDIDGKFTYSKTVTMQPNLTALSIRVSPNPFHQSFSLTVSSPKPANAVVTVTDISGQLLLQQNVSLAKGENSLDAARIAALPQGVYLLSVTTDQQKQTVKFIKE